MPLNLTLAQIGLLADIARVLILFVYGLPSKFIEHFEGDFLLINSPTEDEIKKVEQRNKFIKRMAYIALALIFIGFVFQFLEPFVKH